MERLRQAMGRESAHGHLFPGKNRAHVPLLQQVQRGMLEPHMPSPTALEVSLTCELRQHQCRGRC